MLPIAVPQRTHPHRPVGWAPSLHPWQHSRFNCYRQNKSLDGGLPLANAIAAEVAVILFSEVDLQFQTPSHQQRIPLCFLLQLITRQQPPTTPGQRDDGEATSTPCAPGPPNLLWVLLGMQSTPREDNSISQTQAF